MNRSLIFVSGFLLLAMPCFSQSTPKDSETLQALLLEVRQLRQDLLTTNIAVQRVQILLYRLQGQEAAVARASGRLNEAREMLTRAQAERKQMATEVEQHEDFISNTENPAAQRKAYEEKLPEEKTRLESSENLEKQQQERETEAEQQLRSEETKLSDLSEQLDRLDKTLGNITRQLGGSPQ
jgi:chromosome segregation ATPase